VAGFSIAFNPTDEHVKSSADVSIETKDLRDILPYFISSFRTRNIS
jgi:hypothetical protein